MGFELHLGARAKALIVGIIGGFAGVAVDIDHIPQYLFNIVIPPLFVIQGFFDKGIGWNGRSMHPLVLYICLATFVCITGLLLQYSVRSTTRSIAKSVVTTVQNAISPVPVTK